MEAITLGLFCAALVLCIAFGIEILYALAFGLFLFAFYAHKKGFTFQNVLAMCIEGVKTARNVLITFFFIGILTAFWRASGTIPVIVCYAGGLIRPKLFVLMTFLLNCMVSVLTGTSLGTAATMGVVCATMGAAMGVSPALIGGAVLSGAYFGDRCSSVSTSALLVSELTQTNIFDNIRQMHKTAAVPFVLASLLYGGIGLLTPCEAVSFDLTQLFSKEFTLHWVALLPAVLILVLSAFRVPVLQAMLCSILSAVPLCIFLQRIPPAQLLGCALFGYQASNAAVANMVNGGGIVSMLRVAAIVCLSAAYSGIFKRTGLLHGFQTALRTASETITPYGVILLTAVLTNIVACNQTLSIMLTKQLCESIEPDRSKLAVDLENTVVVVAALVPWSIASAVPLASIGSPSRSVFFAFFLYLLPLCGAVSAVLKRNRRSSHKAAQ